jgi:ankyrin repeat protein
MPISAIAVCLLLTLARPAVAQDDDGGCVPYHKNGALRGCRCATGPQDYSECREGDEESCSYVASCFEEHYGPSPALLPTLRGDRDAVLALAGAQDGGSANHELEVALLVAAHTGQPGLVRRLLEAGAPVTARNLHGQSALDLALSSGGARDEVIAALLAGGMDPDAGRRSPLYAAVHRSDDALVSMLLAAGANPDSDNGSDGISALMCAAMHGDLPILEALLAAGADPTAKSRQGMTAAQLAERGGKAEAAQRLQDAEAAAKR